MGKRWTYGLLAGLLLLGGISVYSAVTAHSLKSALSETKAHLAESEAQRISSAYSMQKQIESIRMDGLSEPGSEPRRTDVADALRAGEIKSVLIIGDSISDGNGDSQYTSDYNSRAENGCRPILTADGVTYYEGIPEGQGWVKYFREYLLSNTVVETFENSAIGGKSAKWGNAHKEAWIPRDYDAIFVMLGTNDRWDCANTEEFYVEYAQLLEYAASRCSYLTVLTPIPAFTSYTEPKAMDTREIADTVLELCSSNGYPCVNLYTGLMRYAAAEGRPLDEYFFGGTHPNSTGYLALWRLIANELGLNLDIRDMFAKNSVMDVYDLGVQREDISESTQLTAQTSGTDIFPFGISIYGTADAFKADVAYGGTVVTTRYDNDYGNQVFKPFYYEYDFIRYYDPANKTWGEWFITNRDQFYKED